MVQGAQASYVSLNELVTISFAHDVRHLFLLLASKKFHKTYMLARELGSGAFSVVKLGINKVRVIYMIRTKE